MYGIDLEVQEKNWNGEGLIKVGNIMDVFGPSGLHRATVKVNYVGEKLIIGTDLNNEESCFNIKVCTFKPVNQAETAKQKAIDEIQKLAIAHFGEIQQGMIIFCKILYEAGYTKSKVKPLSCEVFQCLADANDTHQEDYESLIENGYCIGSAD